SHGELEASLADNVASAGCQERRYAREARVREVGRAGCPVERIKVGNRAYRRWIPQSYNSPEKEQRDDYDILRLEQGGRIDRCLLTVQGKGENEREGRPKKERPDDA